MASSLALTGKHKMIQFTSVQPDDGQICPITQEPIKDSTLDFLDCPFDPKHPDRNAISLACQHTFTALCLIFHWARNDNVLCPLCRAGPHGARLNLRRLPAHFRLQMGRRVRDSQRRDRAEAVAADELVARRLSSVDSVVCIMQGRSDVEYHIRMSGVCIQDQMVFTACGPDIWNFLVAVCQVQHAKRAKVGFTNLVTRRPGLRSPSTLAGALLGFRRRSGSL